VKCLKVFNDRKIGMGNYWEDAGLVKPQAIVVCAACKYGDTIICGARHYDKIMYSQLNAFSPEKKANMVRIRHVEQGFINQFGEFLTREEALEVVKQSGQPFNEERNGDDTKLYSEGLY